MKPLSAKQASNCENAREPVCKCRCGGRLHGAKRGGENPDQSFFETLADNDPHYIPSEIVKEAKRKQRLKQKRLEQAEVTRKKWEAISQANSEYWDEWRKATQ